MNYNDYRLKQKKARTRTLVLVLSGLAVVAGVIVWLLVGGRKDDKAAAAEETVAEEAAPADPMGFPRDQYECVEGKIANGSYFGKLMNTDLGIPMSRVNRLAAADSVFDVRKMRAGNTYRAYYTQDSLHRLDYVVYDENRISSIVFRVDTLPMVWRYERPVEIRRMAADATIESSLWNDMQKAGASPLVILELSDIYAWTVDFFGIQPGDRFRVLYDEKVCEDEVIAIDTVRYAEYIRGDHVQPAIMFNQKDTGNIYWNDKGESLRRAFLKAPLEFKRISSTFTMHRKHPVHGDVRPHTGVDYAAPTGTPVHAVGDGTVISAGWGGGGGNTVKIRHNSVYTTAYLHLSKYGPGIKAGVRVSQGQIIGYVGMTGTATGPHLDYRVWKNGTPINPLTMEAPPAVPIKEENRAALDSVRLLYREELDRRAPVSIRQAPDSASISQ
ncbi:MAG: peptidoglycan DD-metalloendopeptidase family protein [Bacteroidota bacterium]|nr:peptidoglycan DD-metalloendopeptidase family protein [Bacteroidota bacterium]